MALSNAIHMLVLKMHAMHRLHLLLQLHLNISKVGCEGRVSVSIEIPTPIANAEIGRVQWKSQRNQKLDISLVLAGLVKKLAKK